MTADGLREVQLEDPLLKLTLRAESVANVFLATGTSRRSDPTGFQLDSSSTTQLGSSDAQWQGLMSQGAAAVSSISALNHSPTT